MTKLKKIKDNLYLREWKLFEVISEDEADRFDDKISDDELNEVINPKRKKKYINCKKPKNYSEIPSSSVNDCKELTSHCGLGCEIDTARVYFDCRSFVDIDLFIPSSANKSVRCVQRDPYGNLMYENSYYKNEMRCSWFGKMSITKEYKYFGINASRSIPVLSFEFSVAKWWHYTNAVNSGDEPCADLILLPCIQAMKILHIENYSSCSFDIIAKTFLDRAELRRIDLSLNFKVPYIYTPSDYVQLLSHCFINRCKAKSHGEGSISFGTEKSPYRVIVYDKELEAKVYYHRKGTLKFFDEKTNQLLDETIEKKLFYKKNSHLFKNNLRIEVQFRTKFFQEHNLLTQGRENMDNVIRLGKFQYMYLLSLLDEQVGSLNFSYKESEKEPVADVCARIDEFLRDGVFSRTVCANMKDFVQRCYEYGWKDVYNEMGRDLFSRNRKKIMSLFDYDVKICIADNVDYVNKFIVSRMGRMVDDFRLEPAKIEKVVV